MPKTDNRNQVAYVPKPTQTPSAPQRNVNDSGDTHMTEGTVEEEKKSTQPNRTSEHVTKRAKRVKRDGEEDNKKDISHKRDNTRNNSTGHRETS